MMSAASHPIVDSSRRKGPRLHHSEVHVRNDLVEVS